MSRRRGIPKGAGVTPPWVGSRATEDDFLCFVSMRRRDNVLDRSNPRDELDARAGGSLQPGVRLQVLRRESTTLGGLAAERLTLRFEEPESPAPRIRDQVVAFRTAPGRGEIIYSIALDTPEARYSQDRAVFEQVLASWRAE